MPPAQEVIAARKRERPASPGRYPHVHWSELRGGGKQGKTLNFA